MNKIHRILVADDDPEMIKQLLKILTNEEFQVFTCQDGDQVLKLTKEKLPDLILLDWVMPRKTGIEAIIELKDDPATYEIPIIMLTGQSSPDDLEHALKIGADDFIRKPFSKIELLSRIQKQLNQQKMIQEIQNLKLSQMYSMNQSLQNELAKTSSIIDQSRMANLMHNNLLKELNRKMSSLEKIYKDAYELSRSMKKMINNTDVQDDSKLENEFIGNRSFETFLKQKFSSLTESELNICSILLLNLKNSEIAEKLYVSIRTVENHRYHISKKMNVPTGIQLKEFLKRLESEFLFESE